MRNLICVSALLLLARPAPSASTAGPQPIPDARVERAYYEAQARWKKAPNDPEAAWQFGLACFDWADLATNNGRRAEIAEEGIAVCRQAIQRAPNLVASHYYLALNLGQLARTKKLGALKLIGEMEFELKAAIALDPKFDYAGPDRTLGLLYADAPGWPTSIGSRNKARLHLRKAVELSPDYPDNWLSLLETYLKWGEKSAVQSQLAVTDQMLERARKTLKGEKWELSWRDWNRQWEKIKAATSESSSRHSKK